MDVLVRGPEMNVGRLVPWVKVAPAFIERSSHLTRQRHTLVCLRPEGYAPLPSMAASAASLEEHARLSSCPKLFPTIFVEPPFAHKGSGVLIPH